MKNLLLAISIFLSTASAAYALGDYVSDGMEYKLACEKDGYVLTSRYPVVRTVGEGAGTRYIKGIEKIYLGRSCDAYHKIYGTGKWCWANGGFLAEFPFHNFGFPRQELYCERQMEYDLRCGCP